MWVPNANINFKKYNIVCVYKNLVCLIISDIERFLSVWYVGHMAHGMSRYNYNCSYTKSYLLTMMI